MVHLPLNMTLPSLGYFCIKLELSKNILFYTNFEKKNYSNALKNQ